MSIPKIIHQTWKTNELPAQFEKWADTWKYHHPDYKYKLWTDQDNLNLIESEFTDFINQYKSYNHFIKRVDAVRYFYLYNKCLKST